MDAHEDAGDRVIQLDQRNYVTVSVIAKVTNTTSARRTVIFQENDRIVPVYHLVDNWSGGGAGRIRISVNAP